MTLALFSQSRSGVSFYALVNVLASNDIRSHDAVLLTGFIPTFMRCPHAPHVYGKR